MFNRRDTKFNQQFFNRSPGVYAKVATREIHRDDSPLATGTHSGASSSSVLRDKGANFRALGVDPELSQYCENETQSTGGPVTAATEDTVTATGVTWNNGDTYNIYVTSTKDSLISSVWCDVSRGWKIKKIDEINRHGWRHEDWDIDDKGRKNVFGPGQPERK